MRNLNQSRFTIILGLCLAGALCVGNIATAQTMTWGKLTVKTGQRPYDWEIARWIDEYFLDGNPGDGVVRSNIIYIETQCYPEAADNVNQQTGEAVGGAAYDTVSFTNTTYLAAQAPGLPSRFWGYHDDASKALKPGATVQQVHAAGVAGKSIHESPRSQGDLNRKVGGSTSTHVLVWAGKPDSPDHADVQNILNNFHGAANTTVDVLSGDGSHSYNHAESVGAATRANLKAKLDDIGILMGLGEDEQFIFFVTDHGPAAYQTATSVPLPSDTFDKAVPLELSSTVLSYALAETENQVLLSLITGDHVDQNDEMAIGAGLNDLGFLGYLNDAERSEFIGPDGGELVAYSFAVDESLLNFGAAKSADLVTQSVYLYNFSSNDMELQVIELDLGDLNRLEDTAVELAVPTVARVAGAGAFFKSRWDLFNSDDEDILLEMRYTPRIDIAGNPVTVEYRLPAGTMIEVEDPFTEIFDMPTGTAVGSALIRVIEGDNNALRMQTVVSAHLDDASVFGQFFPAIAVNDGISAGETVWLNTTENPDRNRVNVGVMAVADGTVLSLKPVDPKDSALAAEHIIALDRGESAQVNDLDRFFSLHGQSDYLVEVTVTAGSALAYASVLDGNDGSGTSDPTTILPVADGALQVALLELGSIQGLDEFSGSANISNHSAFAATLRADFYQRDQPGVRASTNLSVEPGDTLGYGDVINDLFAIQGAVGTLVLTSTNNAKISASGREFAIFRDPAGEINGTAGQLMPGMREDDILRPDRSWHFIGLRQRFDASGIERSHVALFNPGPQQVTAELALFDGVSGSFEGSITRTIDPGCLIQINNVIEVINGSYDAQVKRIELSLDGAVHARAFRVNSSGDPITIDAL